MGLEGPLAPTQEEIDLSKRPDSRGYGRTLRRGRGPAVGLLLVLIAVLVTACGGSSSSSSSESAASTGEAPASESGSSAINVEPKTIGVIEIIGKASPVEGVTHEVVSKACEALNYTCEFAEGGGDPQKILTAATNFVNSGVDGILTYSMEASIMAPALKDAASKGIPSVNCEGESLPSDLWTAEYVENGHQLAAPLIKQLEKEMSPEEMQIAVLNATTTVSGKTRADAFREAFPSSAFVADQSVDQTDPSGNTISTLTPMLQANPGINVVYPVFDNMVQGAEVTLKKQNSDAKLYSYYYETTTQPLLLSKEAALQAVGDSDLSKTCAIGMDQLVKHFQTNAPLSKTALKENPLTYRVVDKENAAETEPFTAEGMIEPFIKNWEKEYAE
jgi:ABC-type sugar transport system substrate-binding protein